MSTGSDPDRRDAEARRQQLLLQVLWRQQPPEVLAPACAGPADRVARGLQAYAANAAAAAERVLAAACPVLAHGLGPQATAALARLAWRQAPPRGGDLDDWAGLGQCLPALIAEAPPLARQPWLADLARLEWAVHQAERAADAPQGPPSGLDTLAAPDAPGRRLQLRPGTALLALQWPVAALWQQARAGTPQAAVDGWPVPSPAPQSVLVVRHGWRATVQVLGPGDAGFTAAVLAGQTLGSALDAASLAEPGWTFEPWLLQALRAGWITAVLA